MSNKTVDYNARVVAFDNLTNELALVKVKYDEPLKKVVRPGQYVALGLNNEAEPEKGGVTRSMSIASAWGEDGETITALSFYVRRVLSPTSDNPFTHLLWKRSEGDGMYVTRKPVGKFTVEDTVGEVSSRLKVCVAAGTGLAPFLCMVRGKISQDTSADLSDFVILHGVSYVKDLGFRAELEALAATHGLHYHPTISRPDPSDHWKGAVGRVEAFFLPGRIESLESDLGLEVGDLKPARAGVLVCGLQGTIEQSICSLASRGFVPFDRKIRGALGLSAEHASSLWWEQYDNLPALDIHDVELMKSLKDQIANAPA